MFCAQHTPNTSANTFPTTFLTYTTSTEATKSRKNRKKQLPKEFTKENKQTARKATLQKQKNVHAGLRSMLHATSPLSTPYISPGKHLFTYKASQTKSGNMQNLDRHSFPLGFAAMSTRTPSPLQSLQGNLHSNFPKKVWTISSGIDLWCLKPRQKCLFR